MKTVVRNAYLNLDVVGVTRKNFALLDRKVAWLYFKIVHVKAKVNGDLVKSHKMRAILRPRKYAASPTCKSCLAEQSFSCGWCAETGKCIPHKSTLVCPNWGYTIGTCAADCSRNDFKVGLEGYVWLGDDRAGSELYYKGNKQCKWHIAPGQDPSDESVYEVGRIDIVLERADIARRDRLIVYEGNTRSSDAILVDINGNSGSAPGDFPVTVSTSSNMVIFEFSSDHSAATVGTGFLARYKSHKKTFWDSHILVALMLLSICSCMCCLCFRCTARRNGTAEVENYVGMNLEATDHGARLSSINKFPEFIFSDEHKIKMEKLEQEISCCVCLGEYENGEACGFFHVATPSILHA